MWHYILKVKKRFAFEIIENTGTLDCVLELSMEWSNDNPDLKMNRHKCVLWLRLLVTCQT